MPQQVIDPYAVQTKQGMPVWAQITVGITLSFFVIVGAVLAFSVFAGGMVKDVPYCDLDEAAPKCRIATTQALGRYMRGMEPAMFTSFHGRPSHVIDRDGVLIYLYTVPEGEMQAHFTAGFLSDIFLERAKPLPQIN